MAFDAAMVHAIAYELENKINGARIDKVYQPEKDEVILMLRGKEASYRLLISASANMPRIHLSSIQKENPQNPPAFCIALRKHILGGRVTACEQLGFERLIRITVVSKDEMGYSMTRFLYCEIMGKYSNIILTDETDKIIGAVKPVDFTTSQKRQVLPGMQYELPPAQDKTDPLTESERGFLSKCSENISSPDRFITSRYLGLSALTAREIAHRSEKTSLWEAFKEVIGIVKECRFTPTVIYGENNDPIEFSFMNVTQYGNGASVVAKTSVSEAAECYYVTRDNVEHNMQRASDLFKKLSNIKTRLQKKTAIQLDELEKSEKKDEYKLYGDLLTANIYQMKRGMKEVRLVNYYDDNCPTIQITLDERLTPSQNAQKYYKRYTKAKNAEAELKKQLELTEKELVYIDSVIDCLTRAHGQSELDEIRAEVEHSGYLGKSRKNGRSVPEKSQTKPMEYRTSGGYRILSGKNNIQNDRITFKVASKSDWWFHVKNMPGSHTVMLCNGEEPSERDFTEAAVIAAVNSSVSESKHVSVDYTQIRNIKKPGGSAPGFVVYYTNYSAYVDKDIQLAESLKVD